MNSVGKNASQQQADRGAERSASARPAHKHQRDGAQVAVYNPTKRHPAAFKYALMTKISTSLCLLWLACGLFAASAAPSASTSTPAHGVAASKKTAASQGKIAVEPKSVPAAPPEPQPVIVTLPADTLVLLSLDEDMRSGLQQSGDSVQYLVDADVHAPSGQLVIACGAKATGVVTESVGVGGFGRNGVLKISCESVTAVDGTKVAFADPQLLKHASGSQLTNLLTSPVLLMPFKKGNDLKLNRGMPLTMATASDTKITLPMPDPAVSTPAAIALPPPVTVVEHGHNKKPFNAAIKSYTDADVVFTTGTGDEDLSIADIQKLLLSEAAPAAAPAAPPVEQQ
jgi:hypothetical protein